MLALSTASLTNVAGQTLSSSCCLVTSWPGCSTRSLRTANAFGRSAIPCVPSHRHSFVRSRRNRPNVNWLAGCITETSPQQHVCVMTALDRARYSRLAMFGMQTQLATQGGCDVSANSSALANGSAATRSDVRRAPGSTCVRAEGCACHDGWHRNNREQWRPAGGVPRRAPVLRGATDGLADGHCRRLRRAPALERQPARLIDRREAAGAGYIGVPRLLERVRLVHGNAMKQRAARQDGIPGLRTCRSSSAVIAHRKLGWDDKP